MSLILNARIVLRHLYFVPVVIGLAIISLLLVLSVQVYADGPEEEEKSGRHVLTVHDAGVTKGVYTDASTLGEALEQAGIKLEKNDLVEPSLDEELVAASYDINIYRARPVAVVDGKAKVKIMTAYQTPKQIASQAGIELYDEDIVTIGHTMVGLSDGALETMAIDRATEFKLVLYGKSTTARSQAVTVEEMLREKEIELSDDDRLSVKMDQPIVAGMKIELWREGKQTVTREEVAKFPVRQVHDANQPVGYRKIQTPGVDGEKMVTYELVIKNGKEVSKKAIKTIVIKQPKEQTEIIGIKPQTMPYTGGGNKDTWLAASNIPQDQWGYAEWLVQKESGWNPNAVNSSSGACGLGQQLPCGKWSGAWNDPVAGLNGMHGYVLGRYGSWEAAVSHSESRGWY